jgi:hypothetical protein
MGWKPVVVTFALVFTWDRDIGVFRFAVVPWYFVGAMGRKSRYVE